MQHNEKIIVTWVSGSKGFSVPYIAIDSFFRDDELISSVDGSLFRVHEDSQSADSKCAKDFKPNSANRIQRLEENPLNDGI